MLYTSWMTGLERQWPLIQTALLSPISHWHPLLSHWPRTLSIHTVNSARSTPGSLFLFLKFWGRGVLCSISQPGQARDKWGVWSWAQLLLLCNCHRRARANVRTLLINQRSRLCQPTPAHPVLKANQGNYRQTPRDYFHFLKKSLVKVISFDIYVIPGLSPTGPVLMPLPA